MWSSCPDCARFSVFVFSESGRPGEASGSPPLPLRCHVKEELHHGRTPCSSAHASTHSSLISRANKWILICPKTFPFWYFSVLQSDVKYLCCFWFIHLRVRCTGAATRPRRLCEKSSRRSVAGLKQDVCGAAAWSSLELLKCQFDKDAQQVTAILFV